MKPMIWHPEAKDRKVNEYLSRVNRAPYGMIVVGLFGAVCLFTAMILIGIY